MESYWTKGSSSLPKWELLLFIDPSFLINCPDFFLKSDLRNLLLAAGRYGFIMGCFDTLFLLFTFKIPNNEDRKLLNLIKLV